jgi:hypothetical protein
MACPPGPTLPRPATNGSSIRPRNCVIIWKALRSAPVADSPSIWVSALPRLAPVSPNSGAKFAGNAPLVLKALLSVLATACWLPFKPDPAPSVAVRFSSTLVLV